MFKSLSNGTRAFLVGVIALTALTVTATLAFRRFDRSARSLELLSQCRERGLNLTLGTEQFGVFERSYLRSHFVVIGHPEVKGTVGKLSFSRAPWASGSVHVEGVQVDLAGEPVELFPAVQTLLSKTLPAIDVAPINVVYRHAVLGSLSLEGVVLDKREPNWVLRVAHVALGAQHFRNVILGIKQRQDFLEFGFDAETPESAKLRLSQYGSEARGSVWTLQIAYQDLTTLLEAIHFESSPELTNTKVVGQLTLLIPHGATTPRGSLQLTFDDWPKPDWSEAEALLGRTASLFARLAPSNTPFEYELPYIAGTMPLFSVAGSGRLSLLGANAALRFELSGEQECVVFKAHLPPSRYRAQVDAFPLPSNASPEAPRERIPLRAQLDGAASASARRKLALALGSGCGLKEMTASTFTKLELPAFEPRTPKKRQPERTLNLMH